MDLKSEEDLLRIVAALHHRSHLSLIESVGLQQAMDTVYSLGHIVVFKRSAERELRRTVHLRPVGRFHHFPFHRDSAQEACIVGHKTDNHTLARRLRLCHNVIEAPRGKESINGVCHVVGVQRLTLLKRLDARQIGRIQRLAVGKLNIDDRLSFEGRPSAP